MNLICTPHMANRLDWQIVLAGVSSRRGGRILMMRQACLSAMPKSWNRVCKLISPKIQWASWKVTPQGSSARTLWCVGGASMLKKRWEKVLLFLGPQVSWVGETPNRAGPQSTSNLTKCRCALLNPSQTCQLPSARDMMRFPATLFCFF